MPIDLSTLNPPQREAVLAPAGPLVVFAGAGSGKTRVITHRIAHAIEVGLVPPYRILAVTFTNKAAAEMRERLDRLVPGTARDLAVGTFHSICARLLRRHAERLGIPKDFSIYDDGDQKALITRILRDLGYDEKRFPPRMVAGLIERAKQEMRDPSELEASVTEVEHLRAIAAEYQKRMDAAHAFDFGDLIYRTVRALETQKPFALELASRFAHVLVDEFQDTNHCQLRFVLALTEVHRSLCVVGDDDQSIYRWRGADRRNILDFRAHFPEARIIKLEQNYRSTKRILRAAHAVIERAFDREPKELWTDNEEGKPVEIVRCENERDEATLIVRTARELQKSGDSYDQLAVFYRVHAQSRVIEEGLRAASIPYRLIGGVRFYERAEVKDLLAYLRVLHRPEDDVSLLRILNVPARGIGRVTIDKLAERAVQNGTSIYAACELEPKTRKLVELIESLRDLVTTLPLPELAKQVLEATGYAEMLRNENTAESEARAENLAELIGSMEEFIEEAEEEDRSLIGFLERVTLDTEEKGDAANDAGSVTMMTVHAAKGLEFPVVICAGMEEQLFPFRGLEPGADPEELEEERRLAYVAFTRARERLILSWAANRYVFGQLRRGVRSRFLDELPGSDVTLVNEGITRSSSSGHSSFWVEDRGDSTVERFDGQRARSLSRPPVREQPVIQRSTPSGLGPGTRVKHVRYGIGTIVRQGSGDNFEIQFGGAIGKKTIRADFLERA